MLSCKDVIDNITVEDVKQIMRTLDATLYKETEQYLIYNTICHNEDIDSASPKLYYYIENKMFYCYTECGSMSIFKMVEHVFQTRGIEYDWYKDVFRFVADSSSVDFSDKSFKPVKKQLLKEKYIKRALPELEVYPNGILDVFTKYYTHEWLSDNISKAAMDKFNILFSPTRNKIIIPHYNVSGELVGIRGRALDPYEAETYGKYMPVQIEGKWYSHSLSLNLYGLNENKQNIIDSGVCILYEAEKSVLQAESFSMPNCGAAICGSSLNIYQVKLLIKTCHPKEIILALDNEEKDGKRDYFNQLYAMCDKYKKYCNFSFIYDRYNLTGKKDSPTDCGEEIFNQLLKERVIVK